jgi:hypothetical protein
VSKKYLEDKYNPVMTYRAFRRDQYDRYTFAFLDREFPAWMETQGIKEKYSFRRMHWLHLIDMCGREQDSKSKYFRAYELRAMTWELQELINYTGFED